MATIYEYILKLNAKMDGIVAVNSALKKTDELCDKAQKSAISLGGKLKTAFSSIPGADFVTNPIVAATAALYASGKMAMSFDEAMAKVNTTAQLTPDKLKSLKNELIGMGTKAGADLSKIPEAYEKILSQTNDVALSTDIMKASLQGAKAGFTDQSIVAGALAQTLSLIGKENTNAQEVLDTMFAAKRVGAGEFKDFATYIPGLIASGSALGVGFKETAGLFAFMTAKGQSAERSAMLMENAFTALGKSEITKGLEKSGVKVFNADGSMQQMDVIFGQLQKKLAAFGKNDKAKSGFLESIGLRDQQAKQAFMILSSDGTKLKEVLHDVSNAQGETATAFGLSVNPIQNIQMLWSQIQKLAIGFGGVISAILVPAMSALLLILTPVVDTLSWLFTGLTDGNPMIWALVAAIAGFTIVANGAAIITGIVSGATSVWTGAQWLLNAALTANPIGWIVAVIALLVGGIVWAISKTDGWGKQWTHVTGMMKSGFSIFVDGIMIGIDKIQLGWYKFKNMMGLGNKSENNNLISQLNSDVERRKKEIQGAQETFKKNAKWDLTWKAKEKTEKAGIAVPKVPGLTPTGGGGDGPPVKPNIDKVTSGGTRNTSITINLGKMVESIIFQGGVKENEKDLVSQVEAALLRVLYSAQSAS